MDCTWLYVQGMNKSVQPQFDGSAVAGHGMSALPRTSHLCMKLEERDDGGKGSKYDLEKSNI